MSVADLLFWLFAAATCGGAIGVVLSQNIVRMAFWLMASLGSVAGLFFLLSADFLGAAQLLIYVGGTVVLLIFGVMLTASGPYLKLEAADRGAVGAGCGGGAAGGAGLFGGGGELEDGGSEAAGAGSGYCCCRANRGDREQ